MSIRQVIISGMLAAALFNGATQAYCIDKRVGQVNYRLEKQHLRIEQGIKSGKMSPQEAARMHQGWDKIKAEEIIMRKENGGHLTKEDQAILNQQLNMRSKQIYTDKHN